MRRGGLFKTIGLGVILTCGLVSSGAANETITHTYDALGRMVGQVSNGTVNDNDARTYCYDEAGNRTRFTSDESGALSTASCTVPSETTANLSIDDVITDEGGTLSFSVTRSGNTAIAASASYATVNGTAVAPGDYTSKTGTVSFAAGQTSKTIPVTTIDDTVVEPTETMTVTLSGPSTNTTITNGSGTGTINDNDVAAANLSVANASVTEGGSLNFVVTRSGNTSIAVSASYATSNGTAVAPGDYTATSGTVAFSVGQTTRWVFISTANDSLVESAETLNLTLSVPSSGATIIDGTAVGTINDAPPSSTVLTTGAAYPSAGGVLSAHSSVYGCSSGTIPFGGGTWVTCYTYAHGAVYQAQTGSSSQFAPGYSRNASGALQVAPGYYGTAGPLN